MEADLRNMTTANRSLLGMSNRYGEIARPTVILAGARDSIARPDTQAAPLAGAMAAHLSVLPETGQMVHFAHPEQVLRAVELIASAWV